MNRKNWIFGILALVLFCVSGVIFMQTGFWSQLFSSQADDTFLTKIDDRDIAADIAYLATLQPNFGALSVAFKAIAEEKGGVYAFELLRQAPLPDNVDVHLMGHIIGDELFKQQGLEGMKYCTQDFRNACSHSIVIGALLQDGMSVFDQVNAVCKAAPGGPGAYTMCFHGFGHGVLAYTDYEMPDAVELCRKVGTPEYGNNEFHQCVGGMVMEMHDGVHDKEVWQTKVDKYLDPENPLKMCQAEYMPDEAKRFCYTYITPFIFDAAGMLGGRADTAVFEKSFTYCDAVEREQWRRICYGGLGKEFVVLAQNRDVRNIAAMQNPQLQQVIDWCELAHTEEGVQACLNEAQNSLYWGGENHYEVSVRYCGLLEGERAEGCYENFLGNVDFYERSPEVKKEVCKVVPAAYTNLCQVRLEV